MIALNDHPLYRYLDEEEIRTVEQAKRSQVFSPQDIIISTGDRKRDILCIDEGQALVFIENEAGESIEVAILQAGSLIGEMNFVMPTHRTANVKALGEVKASIYPYYELSAILSQNCCLAYKIFAALNLQMTHKLLGILK